MKQFVCAGIVSIALCNMCMAAFIGPSPYLSFADSPINGGTFDYFHLEDFEDAALNTPGLSANAGQAVGPSNLVDSVDGDDGAIDGSGNAGRSWFSLQQTSTIRFEFDDAALGGWPTHAGVVWTDIGINPGSFGVDDVTFEAFDAGGASLGTIGPVTVGDGAIEGGTAEDRFFGATNGGGISAIQLTMAASDDWELDHVQYGRIPEPATSMMLLGGLLVLRRR